MFILRLENDQALQQADVHEHWWIQSHHIEFLEPTHFINNDRTNLEPLLQHLAQRYQHWPPHQQAVIYSQLEELANTPPVVLEEPVISKPRGRPVGTKNKNKGMTQRELSEFEHVKKCARQCGTCHQIGHNCHTCPNA
ncbi:37178_t:CDS:1 [Gigaspora margarita]|uniref:37178_t:CDS:1 n=1 Tax=Gigaspora margarita TaxID=4874 RepID=A0ABN7VMX4_GIGMA|nr:37178_t:CDS:1 [Gigaspora margarita]